MAPPSSPAVALIASSGYSGDTQDRRLCNHIDNPVLHPRRTPYDQDSVATQRLYECESPSDVAGGQVNESRVVRVEGDVEKDVSSRPTVLEVAMAGVRNGGQFSHHLAESSRCIRRPARRGARVRAADIPGVVSP